LELELLMRTRSFVGGLALAVAVAAAVVAGCFSPQQPACAFSCGPAGECPTDYTCGGDGLCHRDDGVGQCLLAPQDGGQDSSDDSSDDASASDAASPN
jgi:hypothetical protein